MRFLRGRSVRRLALDVGIVAVAAFAGVILFNHITRDQGPAPIAAPVEPLLPDLVMGQIAAVGLGEPTADGRLPLLFSATVANIGEGDFVAEATRSWPWSDDWVVRQRIQDRTGGYSERPTDAGLVLAGDGHSHWHMRDVEAHRLEDLETGRIVAEGEKLGYCFYDTHVEDADLPGAPSSPRYPDSACEGELSTGQVVGLSVGWGDIYAFGLPEQRFYVEDVPDGRYRLWQIADPDDRFLELDESNNATWLDFELRREDGVATATVVGIAPGPSEDRSGAAVRKVNEEG
jgi:hypothetical protein